MYRWFIVCYKSHAVSLSNMVSPTEQGRKMPEQNTSLDTSRDKIYPISSFVRSKQKVRKTFDHSFSKMDISALTHCPTKHFVNDLISHQNATHPPRVNKGIQTVFLQNNLRGGWATSVRIISQTNTWTSPYSCDSLKESSAIQISFVCAGITEPNQKPSKH